MARAHVRRIVTNCRDKSSDSSRSNCATGEFFWGYFHWPAIRRLWPDDKRKDWTPPGHVNIGSVVPRKDTRLIAGHTPLNQGE